MIRTWKLSSVIGLVAFILTYWLSIYNNTWQTALFRACIGFLLFFIWGLGFRFILQSIMQSGQKGNSFDEGIDNEMTEQSEVEGSFQELSLEALHTPEQPLEFEK